MSEEPTTQENEEIQEEPQEAPEEQPEAEPWWQQAGFEDEDSALKKVTNLNKWERDLRYESMKKPEPEKAEPEPEKPLPNLSDEERKLLANAVEKEWGVSPDDLASMKAFASGYARESETRAKQYVDEFAEANKDLPFNEVVEIAQQYNFPASTPEELKEALNKAKDIWAAKPENQKALIDKAVEERLKAMTQDGEVVDIKPKREVPSGGKTTIKDFDAATSDDERYRILKEMES